mmetsp:Transcript_63353/g.126989  ORF Transcript_63353/g.126989 Transcript_63353/m.126989 type:complete len:263 (-) Transcript_63353:112-900(-)
MLCVGPSELLPCDRVSVGLLTRKADHLCIPPLEGLEWTVLLPQLFVFLEFTTNCPDVGPPAKPEAALLASHNLGDAFVPQIVQRHLLTLEVDLDLAAVVIPCIANMHRLVQVSQEVDEHLHRIRIGELDALGYLAVVDGRVVYSSTLVCQDLPVEVLDCRDKADAVLAFGGAALSRPAERLRTVIMHLEVEPRRAGEGVVHLVAPAGDVRGVLAPEQPLHLLGGLVIHGARGSLPDGVVRVNVEARRCGDKPTCPDELSSTC